MCNRLAVFIYIYCPFLAQKPVPSDARINPKANEACLLWYEEIGCSKHIHWFEAITQTYSAAVRALHLNCHTRVISFQCFLIMFAENVFPSKSTWSCESRKRKNMKTFLATFSSGKRHAYHLLLVKKRLFIYEQRNNKQPLILMWLMFQILMIFSLFVFFNLMKKALLDVMCRLLI